jgi:hypothetical protein
MRTRFDPRLYVSLLVLVLAGCASGPTIRTDTDPAVDLASYGTFGFFEPLSTDKAGYSTLLTARLKEATRRELESRGYVFEAGSPALRVNFHVNVVEKTEMRSTPSMSVGYGYYRYRSGLYGVWSGYPYDVQTTNYRTGTLVVDFVDTARSALVWQGVAEGRVTRKIAEDPTAAIDDALRQMMAGLPSRNPPASP